MRLGLKYTASNIAISTFHWKSIYIFILVEVLRFDLKFDLEIFGFLRKMGIWDMVEWFNPFLERFEIWVQDLIWELPVTGSRTGELCSCALVADQCHWLHSGQGQTKLLFSACSIQGSSYSHLSVMLLYKTLIGSLLLLVVAHASCVWLYDNNIYS